MSGGTDPQAHTASAAVSTALLPNRCLSPGSLPEGFKASPRGHLAVATNALGRISDREALSCLTWRHCPASDKEHGLLSILCVQSLPVVSKAPVFTRGPNADRQMELRDHGPSVSLNLFRLLLSLSVFFVMSFLLKTPARLIYRNCPHSRLG